MEDFILHCFSPRFIYQHLARLCSQHQVDSSSKIGLFLNSEKEKICDTEADCGPNQCCRKKHGQKSCQPMLSLNAVSVLTHRQNDNNF